MAAHSLSSPVRAAVEMAIAAATDSPCRIESCSTVSGGCINNVMRLSTADGDLYLLKTNASCPADFFLAEAVGLAQLNSVSGPRIPQVIATGSCENNSVHFLVTQWIDSRTMSRNFAESFGRSLALLHREKTRGEFGFDADNYIGSTPQANNWTENWADFFCERRLDFQIALARSNGYADAFHAAGMERFYKRVHELLQAVFDERPALIHGDLWSGNYLCDQQGRGVLIDPAVYYASREAEFGMTVLFGGFDNRFYDAYSEAYPLVDGWRDRVEIYKLYHLLNHLNLFGSSYLSGCREIISRFS